MVNLVWMMSSVLHHADFTTGAVYACQSAERQGYCLFGPEDSGRFKDVQTAKQATTQMMAIQRPIMKGVFFYSNGFEELYLVPDVVVLAIRQVELRRILQDYQYMTGEMGKAYINSLRAVDSDLIVRP